MRRGSRARWSAGPLGWAWPLLFLLPLVPVGVALAIIDWRTRLLPTRVIAPTYVVLIALVLVCAAITRDTDDLIRAGWGWLVSGGLFLVLWLVHPRGLGTATSGSPGSWGSRSATSAGVRCSSGSTRGSCWAGWAAAC